MPSRGEAHCNGKRNERAMPSRGEEEKRTCYAFNWQICCCDMPTCLQASSNICVCMCVRENITMLFRVCECVCVLLQHLCMYVCARENTTMLFRVFECVCVLLQHLCVYVCARESITMLFRVCECVCVLLQHLPKNGGAGMQEDKIEHRGRGRERCTSVSHD